jgi:hypothetical protein
MGDPMKSVQAQILGRIRSKGRGAVHVPTDFLDLGSRTAVDQAVSRLTNAGTIRRIARGVYDFPKQHPRLGPLSPALDRVAAAIARSTGSRIQIAGAQAANAVGVSTQVPARLIYLTDGPTRTIRVGNRTINFRHAAPRKLAAAGTMAGTVVQALRYLGQSGVTPAVVQKIRGALREDERAALSRNVTSVPAWVRPALNDITQAA